MSYADGLAKAFVIRGESDRAVVAVVGDGALTGGMAWEALNNIGAGARPVTVVLNDNRRSYAPTIGALAARRTVPQLAAALGLRYLGPVDGHDVGAVEAALRSARSLGAPTVVHVLTVKGRGYPEAEADPADRMHTIAARPEHSALPAGLASPARSWTSVLGEELASIASVRPDVVAISAAMLEPTGLSAIAQRRPGSTFDVGIAEQHAVTSAAGLAMASMHPVVALYATFLGRAFDQVLLDVGCTACR